MSVIAVGSFVKVTVDQRVPFFGVVESMNYAGTYLIVRHTYGAWEIGLNEGDVVEVVCRRCHQAPSTKCLFDAGACQC